MIMIECQFKPMERKMTLFKISDSKRIDCLNWGLLLRSKVYSFNNLLSHLLRILFYSEFCSHVIEAQHTSSQHQMFSVWIMTSRFVWIWRMWIMCPCSCLYNSTPIERTRTTVSASMDPEVAQWIDIWNKS